MCKKPCCAPAFRVVEVFVRRYCILCCPNILQNGCYLPLFKPLIQNVCMYVCMYVCIYTFMYILLVYIYIYTCIDADIEACAWDPCHSLRFWGALLRFRACSRSPSKTTKRRLTHIYTIVHAYTGAYVCSLADLAAQV